MTSTALDSSAMQFSMEFPSFDRLGTQISEKFHEVDWEATLYKAALLAPKLLLSGAGWAVGFAFGGNIGAGVGDMVGTFVGCVISLGIEILIEKYVKDNPELESNEQIWNFAKKRLKEAAILSCGSLVGGMIFNTAMTKWASHLIFGDVHIFQALATGAITAFTFAGGMTAARTVYTAFHNFGTNYLNFSKDRDYEDLELSWDHFKNDLKLGALIIFPAETAFVATSYPLLGSSWLMGSTLSTLKAAGSVFIGGTSGFVLSDIASSKA